ncbi:MAG: DUF1385 domain-containing protein [Solirubrobacterales bacterium]|nr:DUF1385 domain-containing protein [Solirubrobacterales bacterium]
MSELESADGAEPGRDEAGPGAGSGGGDGRGDGPIRLGGMAMRNGLLIHGPTSWAAATRTADGRIEVASGSKPTLSQGRIGSVPMLRGPVRLAEAMLVIPLVKLRLRSARLPFQDPRVVAAGALSSALTALVRRHGSAGPREELIASLIGILPALTALRDHDLAAYHGVEHKAIGAYETGGSIEAAPKEHQRCGSNLIAPLVVLSTAGQLILERTLASPGPLSRGAVAVAGMGASVELFANAERRPGSVLGRAVHVPGHEIQRLLSTREPTPTQLEIGDAALRAILAAEGVVDRRGEASLR